MPDTIAVFMADKANFSRKRGQFRGTVRGFTNTAFPKTTWKDVTTFGLALLAKTSNKSIRQRRGRGYVESAAWLRAKRDFQAALPFAKVFDIPGITVLSAPQFLHDHIDSSKEYPFNEQFWIAGRNYALMIGAAGAIPSFMELVDESITEAIDDLTGAARGAAEAVREKAGGMFGPFADMLKMIAYVSVAGVVGYIGYQLVKRK